MARSTKKLGDDVVRSFRLALRGERAIARPWAEGDREAVERATKDLQRIVGMSEAAIRRFLKAVGIDSARVEARGDGDDGDG